MGRTVKLLRHTCSIFLASSTAATSCGVIRIIYMAAINCQLPA